MQQIYLAGGCLWGVQEYIKQLPGVVQTTAGRANGTSQTTTEPYDGYAECVLTNFDPVTLPLAQLFEYFWEIIDPFSVNQQGIDVGLKYRSGIYSLETEDLEFAKAFIELKQTQEDNLAQAQQRQARKIQVEVLPLTNFVASDAEHQDRLTRCPDDYCHIPRDLLYKYSK